MLVRRLSRSASRSLRGKARSLSRREVIKGQEDLPGKRVATTRGSTAAEFLREIKASVYEFANIRSVYNALLDNTVDAVVFDAPVLLY